MSKSSKYMGMVTGASADPEAKELVAQPPLHPASFDKLNPLRLDQLYLYYEGDDKLDPEKKKYRYRLTVVDRQSTSPLGFPTAVFLIPAGRETEYIFHSQKGLLSIAESAKCARLVAVSFGRSSTFLDQAFVQEELTYVVQIISRQGSFLPTYHQTKHANNASIPFMAIDGIGSRNVLTEGETTMSGAYLVEQVKAEEERIVRRLYFMDNPFVIQSEIGMLPSASNQVDKSYLAFEYHKYMVAGIAALASALQTEAAPTKQSACVIGLGGGGLLNFLQHVLRNIDIIVVELDPSVVQVAEKYFGFVQDESTHVVVGDGLDVCRKEDAVNPEMGIEPQSLSFLAIDVDSKDNTVGMSCPPAAFCSVDYLTTLKSLLNPEGGVLVINVSARDPAMADLVFKNVQTVFGSVFVSSHNDDDDNADGINDDDNDQAVNVTLLATPQDAILPPPEQVATRIENFFSVTNESGTSVPLDDVLLADLKSCGLSEWESDTKGSSNNKGGKNAKKKKGKRGKKK